MINRNYWVLGLCWFWGSFLGLELHAQGEQSYHLRCRDAFSMEVVEPSTISTYSSKEKDYRPLPDPTFFRDSQGLWVRFLVEAPGYQSEVHSTPLLKLQDTLEFFLMPEHYRRAFPAWEWEDYFTWRRRKDEMNAAFAKDAVLLRIDPTTGHPTEALSPAEYVDQVMTPISGNKTLVSQGHMSINGSLEPETAAPSPPYPNLDTLYLVQYPWHRKWERTPQLSHWDLQLKPGLEAIVLSRSQLQAFSRRAMDLLQEAGAYLNLMSETLHPILNRHAENQFKRCFSGEQVKLTHPMSNAYLSLDAFGNFFSTMRPGSMVLEFQEIEAIDLPELTEEEDYQGMLRTRFQIRFPRANAEWEAHAYYYQVEYHIEKVRKRHGGRERELWQVRLGSMKKN